MATLNPTAPRRRPLRRTTDAERANWKTTTVLLLCSLTILLPLYLAITMPFKNNQQASSGAGFSFPSPIDLGNFKIAWDTVGFPKALFFSVVIAIIAVAGSLIVSSMAAYAIVRNWDHKLYRYSYFYLLAAMFIPFPVVALPQVQLTAFLHLDNPIGVGLLHILFGMSFNVLLYTAFLRSVPFELEESARLDGCSTWMAFRRIILPLLGPMNATVGIFAFLASWNDFMMPSIITANPAQQTLPVVQALFANALTTNYNIAFASYLMAMAPTLIVYVFAQRWVLSGVTQGAIK
jgi:raffinose/stachyose/melibiose transport system permease protein